MTLMPTTRSTGASAATMSQVPQSQVTAHHQHAASPLASLVAGLYCDTSTCSGCEHNDAVYKTVVVLTLKTHAYEMDVQERFARLFITPHPCSFGAELAHGLLVLDAPLFVIIWFHHREEVVYPTIDLLVTDAQGKRVFYDLVGVCKAADSPSSKGHEVWFAARGVWFIQDAKGAITKEPGVMESSKVSPTKLKGGPKLT